MVIKLI